MEIHNFYLEQITPYDKNPRNNAAAVDAVCASIEEFGFQQPVVIDKNNVIIVGHTRWLAAKKLGLKSIPVVIASELTENQVKAYRVADNRTNENAAWNEALLAAAMHELQTGEYDLSLTGFTEDQIENLLEQGTLEDHTPVEKEFKPVLEVVVTCENRADQESVVHLLKDKGYDSRSFETKEAVLLFKVRIYCHDEQSQITCFEYMRNQGYQCQAFETLVKWEVIIKCQDEAEQEKVYRFATEKGYRCRVLFM